MNRFLHFASLCILGFAAISITAQESYNPVADPKAVVTCGHARFTVLTPQLIRMEWSADGKFEDHPSLVFLNRHLPVPKFEWQCAAIGDETSFSLKSSDVAISYKFNAHKADTGKFTAQNLSATLTLDGQPVTWHPGLEDTQNLMGTTRTLDGALGNKTQEPMEQGLLSRSGWALVDDSTRPLFDSANFEPRDSKEPWPWVIERPAGDRQDLYFFGYGHDYKQTLSDYVKVAGRIPLPPRFAFGAWWSRYWAYSDQELDDLVQGFHQNNVPLDVLVIDMDWHQTFGARFAEKDQSGHDKGWTGYSWNNLLFPDPKDFLTNIHAEGLKATLNLHPASGIEPWEDHYPEMARAMGVDPKTEKYIPFDITDRKFAMNYMGEIHHPLEQQGIDFWWLDWQQEQETKLAGVKPTWWLNYVHFTDQEREGKRPLLFHRWGGLGNHRYQIGFSGDTISVWESLAFQPWFTSTAANVGYAYWSHDIGGHMPGAVEPELYTRWVQFGAFSPILRTHTTKNPESERRVWAYPEPYSDVLRSTFQLRYALEPYLYTEARATYDSGIAFLHPLYYDWPKNDEAYTSKSEYVFGSQMLVAPIVTPSDKVSALSTEKIWLPEGSWYEWPTGRLLKGGQTIDRAFTLAEVPVYLRPGAIVPMQPEMLYTGQKPVDPLIIDIWPLTENQQSHYELYEDSGKSIDYKSGEFATTPILAEQHGDTLTVEIEPVKGHYEGILNQRAFELRLPSDWPPVEVTVNGKQLIHAKNNTESGWRFDGKTLTTIIPVLSQSTHDKVKITVQRSLGSLAKRDQLNGFVGTLTRLKESYLALTQTWPVIGAVPDELIDAMQTGDRLSYHPEHAADEFAHFNEKLVKAQTAVHAIEKDFAPMMESYAKSMSENNWRPANMEEQKQRRLDAMARAAKLVDETAR